MNTGQTLRREIREHRYIHQLRVKRLFIGYLSCVPALIRSKWNPKPLNYDLFSVLPSLLSIGDQYGGAIFWEEAVPCQIPDAAYISIERGRKFLSCVRLPGSPTRFCSICGKIRCDKRKIIRHL